MPHRVASPASPLQKRLQEALESAGLTQADIARATDATPTTVHLLLTGVTKKLRGDYALAIEEATGFESQWLINGTGPKKRGTNPEADPRVKRLENMGEVLAIISTAQRALNRIVEDLASAQGYLKTVRESVDAAIAKEKTG